MNYTLYQGLNARRIERFPDLRRAERAIAHPDYESDFHILIGRRFETGPDYDNARVLRIYDRQCKLVHVTHEWPLGNEVELALNFITENAE